MFLLKNEKVNQLNKNQGRTRSSSINLATWFLAHVTSEDSGEVSLRSCSMKAWLHSLKKGDWNELWLLNLCMRHSSNTPLITFILSFEKPLPLSTQRPPQVATTFVSSPSSSFLGWLAGMSSFFDGFFFGWLSAAGAEAGGLDVLALFFLGSGEGSCFFGDGSFFSGVFFFGSFSSVFGFLALDLGLDFGSFSSVFGFLALDLGLDFGSSPRSSLGVFPLVLGDFSGSSFFSPFPAPFLLPFPRPRPRPVDGAVGCWKSSVPSCSLLVSKGACQGQGILRQVKVQGKQV